MLGLKKIAIVGTVLIFCLISCGKKEVEVTVGNTTGEEIGMRTIELPAQTILSKLGSKGFIIKNSSGETIPSQLTYDNLIIFTSDVKPGEKVVYHLLPSDSIPMYKPTVEGAFYPQRREDIAYENEVVGFRIYGPATQQAGEKAFGYDLFFKYPTSELVVPELYAAQCDPSNWAKVDSLRQIDPSMAKEFENSFTYHIDHGKGMDCYAVGPTLGAGVAAILSHDTIRYPWCYEKAEILDNGPLRFTLKMDFGPTQISNDSLVKEHRLITLDSQQQLNRTKVWYDGISGPVQVVAGFPLRDDFPTFRSAENDIIAYGDPTQGQDNGRALLGITMVTPADSIIEKDNHILASAMINPPDTLSYNWGYSWSKSLIDTMEKWINYLELSRLNYTVSIN